MLNSLVWAKAIAEMRATLMTSLERISAVRRVWERVCEEMYGNSGERAYEGRIVEKDGKRECSKVEYLVRCDLREVPKESFKNCSALEIYPKYNTFMIKSQAIFFSSL